MKKVGIYSQLLDIFTKIQGKAGQCYLTIKNERNKIIVKNAITVLSREQGIDVSITVLITSKYEEFTVIFYSHDKCRIPAGLIPENVPYPHTGMWIKFCDDCGDIKDGMIDNVWVIQDKGENNVVIHIMDHTKEGHGHLWVPFFEKKIIEIIHDPTKVKSIGK